MRVLRQWLLKYRPDTTLECLRFILNLVEHNESAKFLDLGCADGDVTVKIGNRIGTTKFYGIDILDTYVQKCRGRRIEAYCADLNEPLPLKDESFDVIHASSVLEHLNHTDLFIQEIHRVLKNGGYAIISTPNLAAWPNIACLFLGWLPFPSALSDDVVVGNPLHRRSNMSPAGAPAPFHRRIPTYRALKELFEFHGFKVEKIAGVGYYPFPIKVARFFCHIDPIHSGILVIKVRKVS